MAEQFYGRKSSIYVSNGGGEILLDTLIAVGRRIAATPEESAVVSFLQQRRSGGAGCRAFSLEPPDHELEGAGRLLALARITAECARRLASRKPDPLLADVVPDREDLRRTALALLLILHEMIGDALPADHPPFGVPRLDLPADERRNLEVELIWRRLPDLRRRCEPEEILKELDRMAALLRMAEPNEANRMARLQCQEARHRLFEEMDNRTGQIETLREIAALTPDEEYRQVVEEAMQELLAQSG
jgi:hypothetical protein